MSFWIFYVPHIADNPASIVDERGRNLMCDRTLPSRLVFIKGRLNVDCAMLHVSIRLFYVCLTYQAFQ